MGLSKTEYEHFKSQTECFGDGWDGSDSGDDVCKQCPVNQKCFSHFSLVTIDEVLEEMEVTPQTVDLPALQLFIANRPDPLDFDLSMESVQVALDAYVVANGVAASGIAAPQPRVVQPLEDDSIANLGDDDDEFPNLGGEDDDLPMLSSDEDDMPQLGTQPIAQPSAPEPPPANIHPDLALKARAPQPLGALPAFKPLGQTVVVTNPEPPKPAAKEVTPGKTLAGSAQTATEPALNPQAQYIVDRVKAQVSQPEATPKRKRGRPVGSKKPISELKSERYKIVRMRQDNGWEPNGPHTYLDRWKQERERNPILKSIPIGTKLRRRHQGNLYEVTLRQGYWEFSHPSVKETPGSNGRWPTLSSITRKITGMWTGLEFFRVEKHFNNPVKEAILKRLLQQTKNQSS